MSRWLIVHPQDPSTRFLEIAYRGLDATVVSWYLPADKLRAVMAQSDRVMMLGHGGPHGLFWPCRFPSASYVIDSKLVGQLKERDDNVFVWCYAGDFVRRHGLTGLATGMFISEEREAFWMGVKATGPEVEESNYVFVNVLNRFASQPVPVLKAAINHEYGRLAQVNPVARYNLSQMAGQDNRRVA
jgi:hypothetical protein